MKHLLIHSDDFCLETGGIENTSYLFAEYFSKYLSVYTLTPKDGHTPQCDNVTSYHGYVNHRSALFILDSIMNAIRIHKKHRLDYSLSVHFGYAVCCMILKLLYGVPYGVLAHGEEVIKWKRGGFISTLKYILYYPVRYLTFRYADQIFTNTNYTKKLVEKLTSNPNIYVINPPIGLMPDFNVGSSNKNHVLLSLGRLAERKGYHIIIKALPQVMNKICDIRYIVAGSGEKEQYLKNLVNELDLGNNVIFKGKVTEDEKKELLSECGLFIMPSFEIPNVTVEGFGLSLLEANSYGKFVVSTWSGGIPEAVDNEKTGFLVKENDVDELANAILRFYDDNFNYNPAYCVEWAKRRHITEIVKQYMNKINEVIK